MLLPNLIVLLVLIAMDQTQLILQTVIVLFQCLHSSQPLDIRCLYKYKQSFKLKTQLDLAIQA